MILNDKVNQRNLLFFMICFFIMNSVNAQTHFIKRYYSNMTGQYSTASALQETPTGEFAMVINTSSSEGGFFLKTDSNGIVQTYKHLGGYSYYFRSILDDIMILNDSNLLIVGDFEYTNFQYKRGLIKMNPLGDVIWGNSLGNGHTTSEDFFIKHSNGKQSLIIDNHSSSGFIIADLDNGGNIGNSVSVRDSNNLAHRLKKVKPLRNNGLVVVGNLNFMNPVLMTFDSSYNSTLSIIFPGFYDFEDVIQTYDSGYLGLLSDSSTNSFTLLKTDSTGTPIWTKSFYDSLKIFTPHIIYENDDHTIYCIARWLNVGSPVYNFRSVIIHLDSIGNIMDTKDSLWIQAFISLQKTSDNRFCSLIAKGSSNSNGPTIMMTDTTFTQGFGNCMPFSTSTSISQTNLNSTVMSSPVQVLNNGIYSPVSFTVFDTVSIYNPTQICLPSGLNCYTEYNTISITHCGNYLHPGNSIPWTTSGIYADSAFNSQCCDSIVSINLTILPSTPVQIIGDNLSCIGDTIVLSANVLYSTYNWSNGDTTSSISIYSTGNYGLLVTSANGCQDSISLLVTFMPYPIVNITAQGSTTFCQGDSVILSANASPSYQWYRYNMPIPGATFMDYTAKGRGKYKCITQNAALCSDTSNVITVFVPCMPPLPNEERADQSDEISNASIHIFPNPGNGIFTIDSPPGQLRIFNAAGELILSKELVADKSAFDISAFSDGIYFVKVRTSYEDFSKKIMLFR